jgi:hypothetical protein
MKPNRVLLTTEYDRTSPEAVRYFFTSAGPPRKGRR